jgi:hypothetical protein
VGAGIRLRFGLIFRGGGPFFFRGVRKLALSRLWKRCVFEVRKKNPILILEIKVGFSATFQAAASILCLKEGRVCGIMGPKSQFPCLIFSDVPTLCPNIFTFWQILALDAKLSHLCVKRQEMRQSTM